MQHNGSVRTISGSARSKRGAGLARAAEPTPDAVAAALPIADPVLCFAIATLLFLVAAGVRRGMAYAWGLRDLRFRASV